MKGNRLLSCLGEENLVFFEKISFRHRGFSGGLRYLVKIT